MAETESVLGIDVGGNHVKTGFVTSHGNISHFKEYPTKDWRGGNNFIQKLKEMIAFKRLENPEVHRVGIGLPGMINRERTTLVEIPNIPELNGKALKHELESAFPDLIFELENDANAAALGELWYANPTPPDSFAFITLGTGIGSAFIIDRKIFTGADGNGLEFGHIVSSNGKTLEENIGKQGILKLGEDMLSTWQGSTVIPKSEPVSATKMVVAANAGDEFSKQVFHKVGCHLGEGLVALIRILDVKTIIIGGGLSNAYSSIAPGIEEKLNQYLTPYYKEKLVIKKAILGNDAGILGAASLCQ